MLGFSDTVEPAIPSPVAVMSVWPSTAGTSRRSRHARCRCSIALPVRAPVNPPHGDRRMTRGEGGWYSFLPPDSHRPSFASSPGAPQHALAFGQEAGQAPELAQPHRPAGRSSRRVRRRDGGRRPVVHRTSPTAPLVRSGRGATATRRRQARRRAPGAHSPLGRCVTVLGGLSGHLLLSRSPSWRGSRSSSMSAPTAMPSICRMCLARSSSMTRWMGLCPPPQLQVAPVDPDEALQRHLVPEPRDDDLAARRPRRPVNRHDVAVAEPGPIHAVAPDRQKVVRPRPERTSPSVGPRFPAHNIVHYSLAPSAQRSDRRRHHHPFCWRVLDHFPLRSALTLGHVH